MWAATGTSEWCGPFPFPPSHSVRRSQTHSYLVEVCPTEGPVEAQTHTGSSHTCLNSNTLRRDFVLFLISLINVTLKDQLLTHCVGVLCAEVHICCLPQSPHIIFETGSLMNLMLSDSAGLRGQRAPWILHLHLSPLHPALDCRHAP